MGRLGKGTALALALTGVISTGAIAASKPPPIDVARGDTHVAGSQGSYCWTEEDPAGTGAGLCADSAYPLPVRCKLKVKRGSKLTIDAGLPATSVSARLTGAEPRSKSRKLAGIGDTNVAGSQRWRFKVKKVPPGAAILDVFAVFPQGDSNVWVGLKTRGCRSADLPKP